MNLRTRIAKLQDQVRVCADRRTIRSRYLKGKTIDEAFALIEQAILPESAVVIEELQAQIEEYAALPPREFQGVTTPRTHGFLEWLLQVVDGHVPLPTPIPHDLLLAWKNGYEKHPCKPCTPILGAMCLHCEMILPNSTVEGGLPWPSPCPVCGSENIKHIFGLHRDPRLAWYFGPPESGTPSPLS